MPVLRTWIQQEPWSAATLMANEALGGAVWRAVELAAGVGLPTVTGGGVVGLPAEL